MLPGAYNRREFKAALELIVPASLLAGEPPWVAPASSLPPLLRVRLQLLVAGVLAVSDLHPTSSPQVADSTTKKKRCCPATHLTS